ncbi:MAG: hypothetical protein JXA21_00730 [Anaerolineae bacterium]|nr:hypothetical protein [Anaerolineae bacterium]
MKLIMCAGSMLLLLVLLPAWMWSTALAAPPEQGTLPPRYSPTPEPTTVVPTTVVPTTEVPTSEPATPTGGETPAPALTATPLILLPDSGSSLDGGFFVLLGAMLVGSALAIALGRRYNKQPNRTK